MALLDTTVLIDLGRRPGSPAYQRAARRVRELQDSGERLFTSRINEAEYRVGPERSTDPVRELDRVEKVLAPLVILEFDSAAVRWYAKTKAALLHQGRPAGDCDTMIAAVALANNQMLVTHNPAHFLAITGLGVSSY